MKASRKYITTKDYLVSGESFDLIYDESLELLKTDPVPPIEEIPSYYNSEEYISHTDNKKGLLEFLYGIVKNHSLRKKVSLVNKLNKGAGSILDVGAGTGDFLREAKKKGWKTFGVEPNPSALKRAQEKGISLESELGAFVDQKMDVVTLWHVLEHIPNLEETIETLSKIVKPGGTLIIAVPNYKSYDAKHYGEFWAAYDVPRHIWHFSQNSIEKLFKAHFKLEDIKPLYFDSFYVSLLSEKYKTDSKFSLKAFWIGCKSNWRARRTNEYSSLIYCLKKPK